MPDFQWSDVTGILTPSTILAVCLAGLALGAFLWTTVAHVQAWNILRIYVPGLAFIAVVGAGRWADLSQHWEAWIGTAFLWTFFVATGGTSVLVWRAYKRRRYPEHLRRNDA